jgi:hypothetical protein
VPEARPRVFISYSHENAVHQQRVLDLASRLRREGVDARIDQYEPFPPEGWPAWCAKEIGKARFVLMVCTETYLRRVNGEEERGKGRGVLWEARLVKQYLFDAGANEKFVPVLFGGGSPDHVPMEVKGSTTFELETAEGYDALYRLLTDQPRVRPPEIGPLRLRPMPARLPQWVGEPPSPSAGSARGADFSPRGYQPVHDILLSVVEDPTAANSFAVEAGEYAATLGRDIFFGGPDGSGKTAALDAFLIKSAGSGREARVNFLEWRDERVTGDGFWKWIAKEIYSNALHDCGVEPPGEIPDMQSLTSYLFEKVLPVVHPLAIGFDEVGRLRNMRSEESFYIMIRGWRERDNRRPPTRLRIGVAGKHRLRELRNRDTSQRI